MKKAFIIAVYIVFGSILAMLTWKILVFLVSQFSTEWMWNLLGSHTLMFGILIIFSIVFFKKFLKILQDLLMFPFDIIFCSKNTNKWKILNTKISEINFKNFWDFYRFYKTVYKNENIKISDKEVILFQADKKFHKIIEEINIILSKNLKNHYVLEIQEFEKDFYQIKISKEMETIQSLSSKILWIKGEILLYFKGKIKNPDMMIKTKYDEFFMQIFDSEKLWETKYFDENIYKNLEKWQILSGFYPEIKNGIVYKNTILNLEKFFHALIVWSTRSGKDVFMMNFIFSILWNIKNVWNSELYFFDTKKSDGLYLENLKSHGIYRYDDFEKYSEILEKFVWEMQEIQKNIWIHSKIENHNKENPKKPLKYKFLVINEFLAMGSMLKWKELKRLTDLLIALTSQWASAGFKIIFISQSARSDGFEDFSKILLNIQTKFVLKLAHLTEVGIVARWLSETDYDRIKNISDYKTVMIEDNSIKQEFKAYLLEQEVLKEWIWKNFAITKNHDFSEKMQDYYSFAKQKDGISYKEATEEFDFTRSEWDKFVRILEENNEIERLSNKTIIWKK